MTRYCYSIVDAHSEFFDAESDTRQGAITAGVVALGYEPSLCPDAGQAARIYIAEIVPADEYLRNPPYLASIGLRAMDGVEEDLEEELGSDDPIVVLTNEQAEHLGRRIIDTLVEYGAFRAWGIKNVVAHDVVVGEFNAPD